MKDHLRRILVLWILSSSFWLNGARRISKIEAEAIQLNLTRKIIITLRRSQTINLILRSPADYDNSYIQFFMKMLPHPTRNNLVQEISFSNNLQFSGFRESYIVLIKLNSLEDYVKYNVYQRGVYLFVLEDHLVDMDSVESVLTYAWLQYGLLSIYLMTQKREILVFDPFIFAREVSKYGKVVKLEERQRLGVLFNNMKGHPLRVEMFRSVYSRPVKTGNNTEAFEGADYEAVKLLQHKMNFTLELQKPDKTLFGYKLPNGTFTGAIGHLLNKTSDIAMTGFFVKDYFSNEVEFTVALYSDELCCFVPKARRVPQSILPLFSMDFNMWMCFGFTAIFCGTVWSMIRWFRTHCIENYHYKPLHRRRVIREYVQIYVDTLIVWLRINLRHFPEVTSERLFLISLALVSVIYGAVFESSLATVYIKPLYYKDINTLKELDLSGLKIKLKYKSMMDDLFPNSSSHIFASLNKKLVLVSFTNRSLIDIMATEGGFAGVTRASTNKLENTKYFDSNMIHEIPECPKTYTLAYLLPINSPYANRVNELLLKFLGAGLFDKFIEDMFYHAKLKGSREVTVDPTSEVFKILTLADLQLAFYCLLIGSIISGCTLLFEKYYAKKVK